MNTSNQLAAVLVSSTEERMSDIKCKEKTSPASDGLKDSTGSHGRQLSLSLSPLSLSERVLGHNEKDNLSDKVRSASEGISESESNFTLIYDDGSGSFLCKHHNKARSYSYPMSSSSSPPRSPYCSPVPKSKAAIPFAWEDKPGVPKQKKAPTPHGCLGELPPPPPSSSTSKFSIRRPKKRVDDVDPFVSALVECTKQAAAAAVSIAKDARPSRRKQCYGFTYLLHEFLRRHRRHSVLNSGCCKTIGPVEQQEQQLENITEIPSELEVC